MELIGWLVTNLLKKQDSTYRNHYPIYQTEITAAYLHHKLYVVP